MRWVLVTHILALLRSAARSMNDLSKYCFDDREEERLSSQPPIYPIPLLILFKHRLDR